MPRHRLPFGDLVMALYSYGAHLYMGAATVDATAHPAVRDLVMALHSYGAHLYIGAATVDATAQPAV